MPDPSMTGGSFNSGYGTAAPTKTTNSVAKSSTPSSPSSPNRVSSALNAGLNASATRNNQPVNPAAANASRLLASRNKAPLGSSGSYLADRQAQLNAQRPPQPNPMARAQAVSRGVGLYQGKNLPTNPYQTNISAVAAYPDTPAGRLDPAFNASLNTAALKNRNLFGLKKGTKEQQDLLNKIAPHAVLAAGNAGLDARTLLSQVLAESTQHKNKSMLSGLATDANNLFGIKAGKSGPNQYWAGKTKLYNTKEVLNGKTVSVKAPFRVYNSPVESVYDYARLMGIPRYKNKLAGKTTVEDQLSAIRGGGYATHKATGKGNYTDLAMSYNSKLGADGGAGPQIAKVSPYKPTTTNVAAAPNTKIITPTLKPSGLGTKAPQPPTTKVAAAPTSAPAPTLAQQLAAQYAQYQSPPGTLTTPAQFVVSNSMVNKALLDNLAVKPKTAVEAKEYQKVQKILMDLGVKVNPTSKKISAPATALPELKKLYEETLKSQSGLVQAMAPSFEKVIKQSSPEKIATGPSRYAPYNPLTSISPPKVAHATPTTNWSPTSGMRPPTQVAGLPSWSPTSGSRPPTQVAGLPSWSPTSGSRPPTQVAGLPSWSPTSGSRPPTQVAGLPSWSPTSGSRPPTQVAGLPSWSPTGGMRPVPIQVAESGGLYSDEVVQPAIQTAQKVASASPNFFKRLMFDLMGDNSSSDKTAFTKKLKAIGVSLPPTTTGTMSDNEAIIALFAALAKPPEPTAQV